ncbi:MAG: HD domain-containing protein [Candidatus Gracilibacteria bacterium]|nr:HD domain-containing protein [Candidatus Gracilibacteria bacterium]
MTTSLVAKALEYVTPLISEKCKNHHFHNIHHTLSVFDRATYLAMNEDISQEDTEDLQIAALFHDTGFIKQYAKNEYVGSQIARKWLQENHYPENRIQKIERIIMATVLFSKPKNILEEIIQDSDLDNIGTKGAFKNSELLYHEIREIGSVVVTDCAFWQFTYRLYTTFRFNTKTARAERSHQKELNQQLIESYLKMLECEVPHNTDLVEKVV